MKTPYKPSSDDWENLFPSWKDSTKLNFDKTKKNTTTSSHQQKLPLLLNYQKKKKSLLCDQDTEELL